MAEIETLDEPGHNLKRTLKDLFAGAAGGVAQVLIGMSMGTFTFIQKKNQKKSIAPVVE